MSRKIKNARKTSKSNRNLRRKLVSSVRKNLKRSESRRRQNRPLSRNSEKKS